MYKISISKKLFDDLLFKKTNILVKKATKYWKKELLQAKVVNDKLSFSIKQLDKIVITNGLNSQDPYMLIRCEKIEFNQKDNTFIFYVGNVIEQRNTQVEENYKDSLIERLLKEKLELEKKFEKLRENYNLEDINIK